MIPLWNAFYFFTLYANAEDYKAKEIYSSSEAIDNYILSKLKNLAVAVKKNLETYEVADACAKVSDFMEILNTGISAVLVTVSGRANTMRLTLCTPF